MQYFTHSILNRSSRFLAYLDHKKQKNKKP